jgi:ferric-dicitrate binding protein FerR (iron transport regulator)
MKPIFRQLDRDAILTMYAADELPADDRREVEQMLAADPETRAELERLQAAWDAVDASFTEADQHDGRVPAAPAERQVIRMLRQWHAECAAIPATASSDQQKRRRYPLWAYPAAAAACVALGALIWWENQPLKNGNDTVASTYPADATDAPASEDVVAEMIERSFSHPSRERIVDAEVELAALSNVDDTADPASESPAVGQDINQ